MASTFTTSKEVKVKGTFGKNKVVPFYLQFVPGVCIETVTNLQSYGSHGNEGNINSILAIPHVRDKGAKKKATKLDDNDRYFPLMRGIVDVPAKGDPVLLCTIGGNQYYLGPLNTNNNPNWNSDNLWEAEIPVASSFNKEDAIEGNAKLMRGESLNFIKGQYRRLTKHYIPSLDGDTSYNENHGDLLLEGRHGNSIRVGSRGENPHIYISNGRQTMVNNEAFHNGTLIAITKKGTLNQHFLGYTLVKREGMSSDSIGTFGGTDDVTSEVVDGFILSSDYLSPDESPPSRFMGDLVSSINNDVDPKEFIYNYGRENYQNQILAMSDRITIDSKTDDIYLSSNKDIHIGAKRHITISTGKNLIIESDKVNLGNPNTKTMEGMVLGEELKTVLKDIVNLLSEVKSTSMLGTLPLIPSPNTAKVMTAIDGILSNKHFVESN